jgi:hypothetical protein
MTRHPVARSRDGVNVDRHFHSRNVSKFWSVKGGFSKSLTRRWQTQMIGASLSRLLAKAGKT